MLTERQIYKLKPFIERWTREAAQRVDELVFRYGYFTDREPERELLLIEIKKVLQEWNENIHSIGGHTEELWTVVLPTEKGEWKWQYPHSVLLSPELHR